LFRIFKSFLKYFLIPLHHTLLNRVLVNEDERKTITLPKSNVLRYKLEGSAWFCIRPSGN